MREILIDLWKIRGAFNCVPKDVAPNKDKGIYFAKAMKDLEDIIRKYEKREIEKKIKNLRRELDALPMRGKFALGSKGCELTSKIFRLECEKERL